MHHFLVLLSTSSNIGKIIYLNHIINTEFQHKNANFKYQNTLQWYISFSVTYLVEDN